MTEEVACFTCGRVPSRLTFFYGHKIYLCDLCFLDQKELRESEEITWEDCVSQNEKEQRHD